MPKTKVPALPEPSTVQDPHLRRVIGSIKEALEIRLGRRGDPMDQAVTFRDLQDAGMIKRKAGAKSGDDPVPFEPDTEGTVGETIERISNEIENSWLFARLGQRIDLLSFGIDDLRSFLGDTKTRVETVVEQTEGQFENVASQITTVSTQFNGRLSVVQNDISSLTSDQRALARQITTVATQFDDKLSFVQNDINSLTSQYEAMASQVTTVAAVANSKNKVYRQSSQPSSANTGDVWIRSSDNRYFYFDGRQWIETGDYRIGQNSAAIQTEQTARATADQALANQITTVQATLNGQIASVQQDIEVTMDNVTGLRASYVLTTDVNGYVSGFGTYNNGKTSDFAVSADRFWIAPPNSWGKVKPFIVQNGRVYIDEARIRNAAIDTAHIKDAAVDTLKVAGQAITIPASFTGLPGVSSTTYTTGSVGWSTGPSASFNSQGGNTTLIFTANLVTSAYYSNEGSTEWGDCQAEVRLLRGSTVVYSTVMGPSPTIYRYNYAPSSGIMPVVITYSAPTGSLAQTYRVDIRVYAFSGAISATVSLSDCSFVFLSTKR